MADRASTSDRDRGSVLLLVPAAMLIVLLLTALVADASGAFLAERELADAAAAAANDAVTAGLDPDLLRASGARRLDPDRVCAVVAATLTAVDRPIVTQALQADPCPARITDDGLGVEVTLEADAPATFGRGLPGAPDSYAVGARRRATLTSA